MPKKRSTEPGATPAKGAGRPAREPRELKALFSALEARPGDSVTLLALADWYEERDDGRCAECLRWVAGQRKAPHRYRAGDESLKHHHESWHDGWYWWTTSQTRSRWGYPLEAELPHAQWDVLPNMFNYDPTVFKEYPTVRAALEALAAAWDPKLVAASVAPAVRKKRSGLAVPRGGRKGEG